MRTVIGGVCAGVLMTASAMASASSISLGATSAASPVLEHRGAAFALGDGINQTFRVGHDAAVASVVDLPSLGDASEEHPAFTTQVARGGSPTLNVSLELGAKRPLVGTDRLGALGTAAGALGTSPVPEPASLLFLGTGLLGLAHSVRRMRRDKTPSSSATSQL